MQVDIKGKGQMQCYWIHGERMRSDTGLPFGGLQLGSMDVTGYVCVCVCMYVCVYVCMCVRMCVCMCVYIYIYIVYMYVGLIQVCHLEVFN